MSSKHSTDICLGLRQAQQKHCQLGRQCQPGHWSQVPARGPYMSFRIMWGERHRRLYPLGRTLGYSVTCTPFNLNLAGNFAWKKWFEQWEGLCSGTRWDCDIRLDDLNDLENCTACSWQAGLIDENNIWSIVSETVDFKAGGSQWDCPKREQKRE